MSPWDPVVSTAAIGERSCVRGVRLAFVVLHGKTDDAGVAAPVSDREPSEDKCRLCGNDGPLRDGHIVPAFIARWLKNTSATGYLRGVETPNRRLQDFATERILCAGCEQRFSIAERTSAERLFAPLNKGRSKFEYESWLRYFAVSLAWRTTVTMATNPKVEYPQHTEAFTRAEQTWREFLLDKSESAGPYGCTSPG